MRTGYFLFWWSAQLLLKENIGSIKITNSFKRQYLPHFWSNFKGTVVNRAWASYYAYSVIFKGVVLCSKSSTLAIYSNQSRVINLNWFIKIEQCTPDPWIEQTYEPSSVCSNKAGGRALHGQLSEGLQRVDLYVSTGSHLQEYRIQKNTTVNH